MPRRKPDNSDFDEGLVPPSRDPDSVGRDGVPPSPSPVGAGPSALTSEMPALGTAGAAAWLRVVEGSVDYREIPLDRPIMVIGRRLTSDVVIHDTNVSRQHARLTRQNGGYAVEDTQSSNGTFVNDERVFGPRALRAGDVIRIGDSIFVYEAVPLGGHSGPELPAPLVAEPDRPTSAFGGEAHSIPPGFGVPGSTVGAAEQRAGDEALIRAFQRDDQQAVESESVLEPDARAAPSEPGQPAAMPTAAREALSDVGRDVASLAASAFRLAERVRHLEDALAADSERFAGRNERGSADDAVALRELRRLLNDLRSVGDSEAATAAAGLLDQLREHPRDVELLLRVSNQASTMAVVMRQQAYLIRLAPLLEEALGRLLD